MICAYLNPWPRAALSLILPAILAACGNSSAPRNPSLSLDVQPILSENCATSGCHVQPSPQLGLDLSRGNTFVNVVGIPSIELPTMNRVEPEVSDESYLWHKVNDTHLDVGGSGARMPSNRPPLEPFEIAVISAWIEAGAPDN